MYNVIIFLGGGGMLVGIHHKNAHLFNQSMLRQLALQYKIIMMMMSETIMVLCYVSLADGVIPGHLYCTINVVYYFDKCTLDT